MAIASTSTIGRRLAPANPLIFVSKAGVIELKTDTLSLDTVGQKTFGLLSLPAVWTLPFLGISADLYRNYSSKPGKRPQLLNRWSRLVADAASKVGIRATDDILVRSSGSGEGIAGRGKFHSAEGTLNKIRPALANCLNKLLADADLRQEHIPLLVQKRCLPERAKGHLSNERRFYKENRDWIGEIESADPETSSHFQINLRHWREDLPQKHLTQLQCSLSTHISESIRKVADWAYRQRARVHFEWVWDGKSVYIVQADEEANWEGHDPIREHKLRHYNGVTFKPQCLRLVDSHDPGHFSKIANVSTYLILGLPTAPLYILDDQAVIKQIAAGHIQASLRADMTELVKGSLVIRTDIATNNLHERQLLPRTDEVRNAVAAVKWIRKQSATLLKSGKECAFIFHNFIPAQSAAFAYADPDKALVQIESLWGLPEGLYYNSHDKYVVDTMASDIDSLPSEMVVKLSVREKRNFKRFFVSTTDNGKWERLPLSAAFGWKGSLSHKVARKIAYESRRIAKQAKKAVSIMWFVGVPPTIAKSPAIPWYHEPFDVSASHLSLATRTKTPFDKCFVIQRAEDVETLKKSKEFGGSLQRIRVQPLDEMLLRDKSTLRNIGELAKAKGATIVLEGAVLSHSFYQLLSTGAIVEIVHPFIGFEERHELNKLVRDDIPDLIRERGESVTTATLDNESLIRALKEKLVEESYELLDARDIAAITAEMADIREVADSLIKKLNIANDDVTKEQTRKRRERGGFERGIVLVETRNVPPTTKAPPKRDSHLTGMQPDASATKVVDEAEVKRRGETLERRTDRRIAIGKVEIKTTVSVPVTRGTTWTAETTEERVEGKIDKIVTGRIKGTRSGSQWKCEVSVLVEDVEPKLL
jgi:predicted house-cleaning noncanonical NTP pyrophosphatase (MazG superfamily)